METFYDCEEKYIGMGEEYYGDDRKIVRDLLARKAYLNVSFTELAERVHKDKSTVQKQLSEKSGHGMNLATAAEYARALGGEISLITEETEKALENSELPIMRARIAELGQHNEYLRERLESKDEMNRTLQHMNEELERQLIRMAENVDRKDKKFSEILDQMTQLMGKLAEKI